MDNEKTSSSPRSGKIIAGLILMTAGIILLLHQMGYLFPFWLTSWPMILIVIGLVIGAKSQFRNPGWIIMLGIGLVFLLERIYTGMHLSRFIAPVVIIGMGLWIMFGRHKKWKHDNWKHENWKAADWRLEHEAYFNPVSQSDQPVSPITQSTEQSESIDAVTAFGGLKKTIFSKNFTGGEVVCFLGGVELNLSQADIQRETILEVTQVLGGTKLIVPSHWNVVSEMTAVFGGIEDKRIHAPSMITKDKTLIIRGTSVLGGIEIQSYI